ncbi:Flavodoxin [Clostridium cavendishii DSM 21758]|uniref:Flavodoxin n=1 Tax=Clostridium cavendishii DSM 21758 TaxID=1121302 RepID=A0A1M6R8K7_9CLOT|nr:flavodoxin [Clostridium cavendishii]SHK28792.1 Flavodoxin [Clostridium cavendishii DSM 21758]
MKKLVVFYSLEGHTKFIAEAIAKELKCDLLELKPEKEIAKTGFKKYFWGGMSVMLKEKPALQNQIPDLKEYDSIFIGTPVWAGTYAPAVNTFLSNSIINQKKIALFASHGGGGAQKCFDKLRIALREDTILGEIDFVDSKEDEMERIKKIKMWLDEMLIK